MSTPNTHTWASHLFFEQNQTMKTTISGITDKAIAIAAMTSQQSGESITTGNSDIWYSCSLQLQKDRDVALTAVKTRCIPTNLQEWPTELKHDIGFWNDFLSHQGKGRYDDQHASLDHMKPERISWCVPKWKSEAQIKSVLHCLPGLGRNANFWYTVLFSNFVSSDLLIEKAHPTILSNKHFMIHAIQNDFTVYDALCAPLNQDEDIVVTALQQHTNAIIYIPAFIQELYPDAVANSIRDCMDHTPNRCQQRHIKIRRKDVRQFQFGDYLSNRLWRNRNVVVAWISKGGRYRDEDFPAEFENDEEIFLLVAQYNSIYFTHASYKLRSDKAFMKKAVAIDSDLFFTVGGDLKYDFDLAVIAYASKSIKTKLMFEDEYDYDFFNDFHEYLDTKKQEHDSFFLFVMSVLALHPDKQGASNELAVLNQGTETTFMIFKLMHEFVGSPRGIDLLRIRQARTNILANFRERT